MKEFICYDKKSVDDLLICKPLSYEKLSEIILDSKCKYSSAQSMKRTYVIEYKSDGTFIKIVGEVARYQGATFEGSADSDGVKNTIELDDFTTAGIKFSIGKTF